MICSATGLVAITLLQVVEGAHQTKTLSIFWYPTPLCYQHPQASKSIVLPFSYELAHSTQHEWAGGKVIYDIGYISHRVGYVNVRPEWCHDVRQRIHSEEVGTIRCERCPKGEEAICANLEMGE